MFAILALTRRYLDTYNHHHHHSHSYAHKNFHSQITRPIFFSNGLAESGTGYFTETVNVRTGPSTSSEVVDTYSPGMSVIYDSLVQNEGRTWISYISSSGERHYCCAIDVDGSTYIKNDGPSPPSPSPSTGGLPIPQYYQWQYDEPYGEGTIANCGCGPTAFAMVASYLLDSTITPVDAIAWCGNDYYCWGSGTYYSYFQAAATHFGIGDVTESFSGSEAYSALGYGQPIISSQHQGLFTNGGHFIVLRGIADDGCVLVCDPNDNDYKNYHDRHFDFYDEIDSTNDAYFIYPSHN